MIVPHASVLIAHLDATDAHHPSASALLLNAAREPLSASPLTLAEVLVGPSRAGKVEQANAVLGRLQISGVPIPDDAVPRLAALRVQTGLKLPDCCVLLAAEQTKGTLAAFDRQLASAAGGRGLEVRSQ